MGIEKINPFLKENCPDAFGRICIDALRGYRISVDASGWVYSRMSVSNKNVIYKMPDPLENINRKQVLQNTYEMIVNFIIGWQNYGVTLIWCWDGEPVPEKQPKKDERAEARETVKKRIEDYKTFLRSIPVLSRTAEQIMEMKKLLAQYNVISREEMASFRNLVEDLGYPSLQSKTEGEKLAASLAQDGLCIGVWSEDTDNYPLGTPLMITEFAGMHEGKQMVSVVMLHKILAGLSILAGWQFTQQNLIDFCIMCGCDFNHNMPGIGVKRAWELIKKYGNIDVIAVYEPHKPIHILNHRRSRELFAYEPSGYTHESKDLNHNKEIFGKNVTETCVNFGLETLYQELIASVATTQLPISIKMISLEPPTEKKEPPSLKSLIAKAENTLATRKSRFIIMN